ncbi:8681_t:CDS:2 [Paraglomus occultum]|uniref:glutathione-specific gamma-glutamylcyclotransferase n=1 Tax=Paraglomus occultum TaxID=144539 RepID=A0A9N9DIR6_9GLOM|nr:8681_t:CDS:2 [Paraglomus occultum]
MSELLTVGNAVFVKDRSEYTQVERYQLQTQHCVQLQQPRTQPSESQEYWVFGYGSLIWKPPIAWEKRLANLIALVVSSIHTVWASVDNVLSTESPDIYGDTVDHRGTIEKPGRVVTLIPHSEWKLLNDYHEHREDDVTWGVAYKIPSHCAKEVKDYLDRRESGYAIKLLDVYQKGKTPPVIKQAVVYIATTANDDYCGPAPIEDITRQIFTSREYALNLAKALRDIAPDAFDHHLYDLEKKLLELEASRSNDRADC